MPRRFSPVLALLLSPLLGFLSPACDSDDCPAGHEGCACAEEYSCLDGLQCLSEYCVAPAGSMAEGSDSHNSDNNSGNSSANNVAACEAFLDSLECAELPGGTPLVDCSTYQEVVCDISDYLDCLTDNTTCTDGVPDASQWADCASLATGDCA